MKITQKLKNKVEKKVFDAMAPIINRFLNASHQVAFENGCKLTFEEFELKVRDFLAQTEKEEL